MATNNAAIPPLIDKTRLAFFERYLSLWVGLCMAAGVALGKLVPSAVQSLRIPGTKRSELIDDPALTATRD